MANNDVLQAIQAAKLAHLTWVSNAFALIQGMPLEAEQVPLKDTECAFGKWYYGENAKMLAHLPSFREIEPVHSRLHEIYSEIFTILFDHQPEAETQHLLGATHDVDDARREAALAQFVGLQKISDLVIVALTQLEAEVAAD